MAEIKLQIGYDDLYKLLQNKYKLVNPDGSGTKLEREENTFGIEVKNSIVQQFTSKYLKGLVSEKIVQDAMAEVGKEFSRMKVLYNTELNAQIKKQIGESNWSSNKVTLSSQAKTAIQNQVTTAVEKIIKEQIKELMKTVVDEISDEIRSERRLIRAEIEKELKSITGDSLEKYIDTEVQIKIKAILGQARELIGERDEPSRNAKF